jgi:hypothetical protein
MMHNTGIKSGSAGTTTGALSVGEPQPVWMTLDEARERAFTGEIVFEVDPEVLAYLDHGVIYYAERASDEPLGRRLIDAGVVDTTQLERGTVRVGDVEHLGRLFDRDASVDRDAVLVVTETSTEDLIAELANHAVTTVRVTAYRHHPSGVHRWFAAPLDSPALARPVAPVAQIDNTVIDELPGIAIPTHPGVEDLSIEWDDITDLSVDDAGSIDEFELFDPFREPESSAEVDADVTVDSDAETDPEAMELALDMASFTDTVDETADDAVDAMADDTVDEMVDDMADFEFQVVWPNGSEGPLTNAPVEAPVAEAPAFTETADGALHFDLPELERVDDEATDEVPDEVAAAVRRAIAAIESASAEPAAIAAIDIDAPSVDVFDGVVVDTFDTDTFDIADTGLAEDAVSVAAPVQITTQVPTVPATLGGFAPPTLDMAAEAIYAREAAAIEAADIALAGEHALAAPSLEAVVAPVTETAAAPVNQGVASVVFVDGEPVAESGDERNSALRRLIGSLRRKDH